ncbi:MAG: succinylglutamate desuccinylase, partial [Chitinophagaceae bacterium]
AYNLQKHILPFIDYGLDFHTGGSSRSNYPQVRCDFADEKALQLAEFFAPPFIIHSQTIPQSLRNEAKQQGKSIIVYEAGQALRFDENAIEEGIEGTVRLMKALHFIPDVSFTPEKSKPIKLHKTIWVRAEDAGLFNAFAAEGEYVEAGDKLGTLTDPYNEKEVDINSPQNGFIIGQNNAPIVNAGDALFHIGMEENKKNGEAEK